MTYFDLFIFTDLVMNAVLSHYLPVSAQTDTSIFSTSFSLGPSRTSRIGLWATFISVAVGWWAGWVGGEAIWSKIVRALCIGIILGHGYLFTNQIDIPFIENWGK